MFLLFFCVFLLTEDTLSQPVPQGSCDFVLSPQLTMLCLKNSPPNKATLKRTHTHARTGVHTHTRTLQHKHIVNRYSISLSFPLLPLSLCATTQTSLKLKHYNLKVLPLKIFFFLPLVGACMTSLDTRMCSLPHISVHVNICRHIILCMHS